MEAMSSYEEQRAAKIARNKAMLVSLGLDKPQPPPAEGAASSTGPRTKVVPTIAMSPRIGHPMRAFERRKPATVSPESPLRRSLRVERNMQLLNDEKRMSALYANARITTRNYVQQQKLLRSRQMKLSGPNARTDTSFSTDVKNKRILNESGRDAPKRHVLEFSVTLNRSIHGYCIYLGIVKFSVCVLAFRRPTPCFVGPAEACGLIQPQDKLVSINGAVLFGGDDFKRKWAEQSAASSITLGFRRLLETI